MLFINSLISNTKHVTLSKYIIFKALIALD